MNDGMVCLLIIGGAFLLGAVITFGIEWIATGHPFSNYPTESEGPGA